MRLIKHVYGKSAPILRLDEWYLSVQFDFTFLYLHIIFPRTLNQTSIALVCNWVSPVIWPLTTGRFCDTGLFDVHWIQKQENDNVPGPHVCPGRSRSYIHPPGYRHAGGGRVPVRGQVSIVKF